MSVGLGKVEPPDYHKFYIERLAGGSNLKD